MTIHIVVSGKVQGVFFRASAREKAVELGIKGWVKNTFAGDVEITAGGQRDAIRLFTEWCRRGPSRAVVTGVQVQEIEEIYFEDFVILRDGKSGSSRKP